MKTAKTAISLPQKLLEATDKIAKQRGTSRSKIVAIALNEYIQRLEAAQMLAQINEVYSDEPLTPEEFKEIEAGKTYVGLHVIEQEEWE